MALLFISYRRATAGPYVSRLNDWLADHFEKEAIFYDRGSVQPGEEWRSGVRSEIEDAVAVLAIIDQYWLGSFVERSGSEDIVRFEIETAIELGKTIMPLLVGGYWPEPREAPRQLPPTMHSILDRQFHVLDDTSPAMYETSITTLIAAIEHLPARVVSVEETVFKLLIAKDYVAAERLLVRRPRAASNSAKLSAYLALARLAGRSFNALYPAERETIEMLLKRARAGAPDWDLPQVLLAILETDYYELNGIVSDTPVTLGDVVHGRVLADHTRALLSDLNISRRARRELRLDALSSGGTRC